MLKFIKYMWKATDDRNLKKIRIFEITYSARRLLNLMRDKVNLMGGRRLRDPYNLSWIFGMLYSSSHWPPCYFLNIPKHATALDFWHLPFSISGKFFSQIVTWSTPSVCLDVSSNVTLLEINFLSSYLNSMCLSTSNFLLCLSFLNSIYHHLIYNLFSAVSPMPTTT